MIKTNIRLETKQYEGVYYTEITQDGAVMDCVYHHFADEQSAQQQTEHLADLWTVDGGIQKVYFLRSESPTAYGHWGVFRTIADAQVLSQKQFNGTGRDGTLEWWREWDVMVTRGYPSRAAVIPQVLDLPYNWHDRYGPYHIGDYDTWQDFGMSRKQPMPTPDAPTITETAIEARAVWWLFRNRDYGHYFTQTHVGLYSSHERAMAQLPDQQWGEANQYYYSVNADYALTPIPVGGGEFGMLWDDSVAIRAAREKMR